MWVRVGGSGRVACVSIRTRKTHDFSSPVWMAHYEESAFKADGVCVWSTKTIDRSHREIKSYANYNIIRDLIYNL